MQSLKHFDVIFVGAGASALMAASNLPKNLKILLIESNSKIGQKILVSGGGKCNIVNQNISHEDFLGDCEFLEPLLESYSYKDILNFFSEIEFEKRKGGKFFTKNGAKEIIEFFTKRTRHCQFALSEKCQKVDKKDDIFTIFTDKNTYACKKLVVASGGLSYPKLNSSHIGYEIAQHFGLEVAKTNPALVGLSVQKEQFWFKNLSGISLKAKIKVEDKIFYDDILFSHRGISGLGILNASLFWQKGSISLDFLPDKNIKNFLNNPNKQISSLLPLPRRFIKAFLEHLNIEDKQVKKINKDEFSKLQSIHDYKFAPAGNFGYQKAEVTKGGVKTKQINPQTYECLNTKGLYFIGEALDITGRLGGFNFYFAFCSALKMAKNL